MDLSDCVNDIEATKQILFCYLNYTVNTSRLLPDYNADSYLERYGVDITAMDEIDSVSLFGAASVFPYNATDVDVDCFSWTHGTTRTEDWHQCNATESGEPPNLIYYFAGYDNFIDEGLFSTELHYNSSYYLCYDELNCTTQTTECDESAGYYCVGRLDNITSSTWFPCDTTHQADYYRCCKGGCDNAVEMMCGEYLLSQDGTLDINFTSCAEDGTSGCCDSTTDCVYNNECYDYRDTTSINGIIMQCREYSHWCPDQFTYSSDYDECVADFEACYDPSDEEYCNTVYGATTRNAWEQDSGCIRDDPEGITSIDDYNVYKEACVQTILEGIDYFFYQDIEVR